MSVVKLIAWKEVYVRREACAAVAVTGLLTSSGEAWKGFWGMGRIENRRSVLSHNDIDRALTRIAHEIVERNKGAAGVVLMGIASRGFPLAERLAAKLQAADHVFNPEACVGQLDVTMFRDDLTKNPTRKVTASSVPRAGIDGSVVVLVDDVFYSGRTTRAALDALGSLGRPQAVQLAVLVDRGHRQLPIQADYVGKNLPTSRSEAVKVLLEETDGVPENAVFIYEAGAR